MSITYTELSPLFQPIAFVFAARFQTLPVQPGYVFKDVKPKMKNSNGFNCSYDIAVIERYAQSLVQMTRVRLKWDVFSPSLHLSSVAPSSCPFQVSSRMSEASDRVRMS